MGLVVRLSQTLDSHAVEQSLQAAPTHRKLRDAATDVIAAVHGLPELMDAQLGQIEVYLGRAGATSALVRNRWSTRYEKFNYAPSSVALVVFRARTDIVRDQRWERASQLLINSLNDKHALCCANALTGDSGRWPGTDDCAIYLVAKLRPGPAGHGVRPNALNAAVSDLLHEEQLEADVVRAAARAILNPDRGTGHDFFEHDYEEHIEEEREIIRCKRDSCLNRAYPGNFGFCRLHRPHIQAGQMPCRAGCGHPALPGNYGFCGRHRR